MAKKVSFKKGSKAAEKRSEIAEAIHRDNPSMPMAKKMRLATGAAKKFYANRKRGR